MNKFLVLALVSFSSSAFANSSSELIIGGNNVNANDPIAQTTVLIYGTVPAQSQFQIDAKKPKPTPTQNPSQGQDQAYICTGTLIAQDIVVTAAHCVATQPENIRIVFDTDISDITQANAASKVRKITGYLANPKYAMNKDQDQDTGDIAVIRIAGSLPDGYHPATLYSGTPQAGDDAVLAGYGITDGQTQAGSGVLRQVSVPVASVFSQTEIELDQRGGKGACHGDSGGPAFANTGNGLALWGVTSRGYPNTQAGATCTMFVVYTEVGAYTDFIAQAEQTLRSQQ